MTRALLGALLLGLSLSVASAAAVSAQDDDVPDACRTIVGCPDAGPKPENPGDRGGYAQFMTLGALVVGVGFIGYRISRAVRTGPPDPGG